MYILGTIRVYTYTYTYLDAHDFDWLEELKCWRRHHFPGIALGHRSRNFDEVSQRSSTWTLVSLLFLLLYLTKLLFSAYRFLFSISLSFFFRFFFLISDISFFLLFLYLFSFFSCFLLFLFVLFCSLCSFFPCLLSHFFFSFFFYHFSSISIRSCWRRDTHDSSATLHARRIDNCPPLLRR